MRTGGFCSTASQYLMQYESLLLYYVSWLAPRCTVLY